MSSVVDETRNYLPFVRKVRMRVAASSRDYIKIPSMAVGGGNKIILQDVAVCEDQGELDELCLMRVGILGFKYLTEEFFPIRTAMWGVNPLHEVWEFEKPYRLFPGESLRVNMTKAQETESSGAVMFNGYSEVDGRPVALHDSDGVIETGTNVTLAGKGLACPDDGPVVLTSVTFPVWEPDLPADGARYQIYSPDNRAWIEAECYIPNTPADGSGTIGPMVSPLVLGERNGWVLSPDQVFTLEFDNLATLNYSSIFVVLRGFIEVNV